jgi:GTP:adenosylcobinamide-phosphate guanylyltransferase
MVYICILCGGPPKKNRERHTEIKNNKIIINNIIDNCSFNNINIYVIIHEKNKILKNHISNIYKYVNLIEIDSKNIYDTFKTCLNAEKGKCIMVCGDLINLKKETIDKFINSTYSNAICKYNIPWGENIISKNGLIRRSDIGDCISMIDEKYKEKFLSSDNYNDCLKYLNEFYPKKIINYEIYNDIGTHLVYSFFYDLASNPNIDNKGDFGLISCNYKVYEDND